MAEHSFVKCEAVKTAYRQTKDGMVISFAIHPNELPPELALAPVGARVLLAVAEIADDTVPLDAPRSGGEKNEAPAAVNTSRSDRARDNYRMADEMQRAVMRAGMLCKDDRRYWEFLMAESKTVFVTPEGCANAMRLHLDIKSRSEIGSNPRVYEKYIAHEDAFKRSIGLAAQIRS